MAQFQITKPTHFIALGFGAGLLKPAPGTWGTLAGVLIYLALAHTPLIQPIPLALLISVFFVLGCYICGQVAADIGVHDHSAIVWDEIVGYLLTMALVTPNLVNLLAGFVLFRLLDIIKPWPIYLLDRQVHGGLGIMLDDMVAGLLAAILLFLAQPYLAGMTL